MGKHGVKGRLFRQGSQQGPMRGIALLPWEVVAVEYQRRTGERMTTANARMIYVKAIRKLADNLISAGVRADVTD